MDFPFQFSSTLKFEFLELGFWLRLLRPDSVAREILFLILKKILVWRMGEFLFSDSSFPFLYVDYERERKGCKLWLTPIWVHKSNEKGRDGERKMLARIKV